MNTQDHADEKPKMKIIVPAFDKDMPRQIATRHEAAIAQAMLLHHFPPPKPRNYNHFGKRDKFIPIWLERAEKVREVLRQYPNSESATIAVHLDIKGKTAVSWLNYYRANAEEHGISFEKDERTGRWRYFLAAE